MARKKSSAAETEQQPEPIHAEPQRGEKSAAIRALIGKGMTSAKDISEEMARQGLTVSMPVIYTILKEPKKGGRRKKKEAAPATAAIESSGRSASAASLTAGDLNHLAEITKKAGGVDAVVGLLNAVKHFQ